MTPKKRKRTEPCMDLGLAKALYATGESALKQAHQLLDHLEELGEDVSLLRKKLREGEAGERLGKRMLKRALEDQELKVKKV